MALCTPFEWSVQNIGYREWYLQTYPWLKEFPPVMKDLQDFYVWDMINRNLLPLENFVNCYEFLFSYALENIPRIDDPARFKGQTFAGRLIKDQYSGNSILWDSIKKTGTDISKVLNVVFPVALVFLAVYLLKD